jgi:hypothetical protein
MESTHGPDPERAHWPPPSSYGANGWGARPQWQQPGADAPLNNHPGPYPGYQAPPKPGVIPLRPLVLGEILDGAFQACRRNALATFGTAILVMVGVTVISVLAAGGLMASLFYFDPFTASGNEMAALGMSFLGGVGVLALVSAAATLLLQGMLVVPVARSVLNQHTGFRELWKISGPRLLPLLGLGLLVGALAVGAFTAVAVLLVAAGMALGETAIPVVVLGALAAAAALVWVTIKLVLAPAVLMLEETGPWLALRRSWQLTRRSWWRTLGIVLLTSIIVSVIVTVITTPLSLLTLQVETFTGSTPEDPESLIPLILISQGLTAVFSAVGYSFQAAVTALLYVDLRMRREGFDVVLMRGLGG